MSDSRVKLGDILCESRIPGSDGATARKITVKLYGRGVVPKNGTRQGSAATKYYRRHAGQLIYSKLDFLNGAIGVVPPELANHESTLDLPCFDIISADADPQWLLYYLSRPIFYLSFRGGAIGGRKAKRVQPAELIARRITLPPLSEQRRIAAILNAVDAAIARTKGLICELRKTKRQVMGELFARAQIQEAVPIGKVARIGNGTTPRKSVPTYWDGGTVPWLSSGKVNDYRVRRAEDFVTEKALSETSVKLWLKGTVLVGLIGQGRTRGMVARMEIEACINQNVAGIVCGERLDSEYLFQYLGLQYENLRRSSRGSHQDALNCQILKAFPVPLPFLSEQRKIATIGKAFDCRIETEEATLTELKATKQGLMQELLEN